MKLEINDIVTHLLSFENTKLDLDEKESRISIRNKYNRMEEDKFVFKKIENTEFWTLAYFSDGELLFTKIKKYKEIKDCLEVFKNKWIIATNIKRQTDSINKGQEILKSLQNFLSNDDLFKEFKDNSWKIEDRNLSVMQLVHEDKTNGFTNVVEIEYKGFLTKINIGYCIPRGDKLHTQSNNYLLFEDELENYPLLKNFSNRLSEDKDEVILVKENSSNPIFENLFLLESMQNEFSVKSSSVKKQKI